MHMDPIAPWQASGGDDPPEGTRRIIDQRERVFYCGYWIKTYPVTTDSLTAKKTLIEALTRRLFNHTEHGLNVPGSRLDEARAAHAAETDPSRRRIKAGMLAGALVNRAADIFRRLVELQADGVEVRNDYFLVKECGKCLTEALELGRQVKHRSGEEGIDELWGEPFRAFSLSVEEFYESRYIKIGQCMRDVERIGCSMTENFGAVQIYSGIAPLIHEFAVAGRTKAETLRTDPEIFDVWSRFVTAGERLVAFAEGAEAACLRGDRDREAAATGSHGAGSVLIRAGRDLIFHIVRARTPMPKSMNEYIARCDEFRLQQQPRLEAAA